MDLIHILLDLYLSILFLGATVNGIVFFNFKFYLFAETNK